MIIIGGLIAKIGKEQIFKHTIEEHNLYETSNDNGLNLYHLRCEKR